MDNEGLKPILISWKKTDKERKLENYVRNKSCYAAWAKDAMFEKMEREENGKQKNILNELPVNFGGVQFRDDIM